MDELALDESALAARGVGSEQPAVREPLGTVWHERRDDRIAAVLRFGMNKPKSNAIRVYRPAFQRPCFLP